MMEVPQGKNSDRDLSPLSDSDSALEENKTAGEDTMLQSENSLLRERSQVKTEEGKETAILQKEEHTSPRNSCAKALPDLLKK